ncbi:membrane protein [Leclercia adecarboxylata]|nr:membrane protein [Leclercia adecarboxylata]KMN59342.1 membrane protein [Leclercia sp. LK8]
MKYLFLFVVTLFSLSAYSADNVFFRDGKSQQITLSAGQSIRSDGLENLYASFISYSEPSEFFFLQAKTNLELGEFKAFGSDTCNKNSGKSACSTYNQVVFGLSKDVALIHINGLYTGVGLGAYIKSKSHDDMRVNSAFTFGEKAFIGWNFGSFATEAYIRHFSNGTLTDKNSGHNFVGAAISYNF